MPRHSFATKVKDRPGQPRQILKNYSLESDGETLDLVQRPSLVPYATRGTGPIRLRERHLGHEYELSGVEVFRDGVSIGTVASGGFAQAAGSESELVFVAGWNAYLIGDASVTQITDPDLPQVSGVVWLGGRFYYIRRDTGEYVPSEVGTASNIDPLAFENAESNPDNIVRAVVVGDYAVFLGTRSVEFHYETGSATAPLLRSKGRNYNVGCAAAYSVVAMDNAFLFVGWESETTPRVFRGEAVASGVSDPTIDAKLKACTQLDRVQGLAVSHNGTLYYVLNIPGQGSWALNLAVGAWSEWTSYGQETFRLRCGDAGIYGDSETGQLWTLGDGYSDGSDPIIREATVWIPAKGSTVETAYRLEGAYGVGLASGQGADPLVEMRYSNGGLGDWSEWVAASIGLAGGRSVRALWPQNGMMTAPGRLLHFRWSDPVLAVPYYVASGADAYG